MAKEISVADQNLPGKVLEPNAGDEQLFDQPTGMEQFGTEMPNPSTQNAVPPVNPSEDAKRFEYHQSRADKAEAKLKEVESQLIAKSKMDPLIELIQKDEDTFKFIQSRLNGNRTPDKPLEPPQKPNSYNEVEAYSNPESDSFKYRTQLDNYRDVKLQAVEKQNALLLQGREQERAMLEQQRAHQEGLHKFKQDILSKGIADTEFAEFFDLVNKATPDDMVDYFKFKKSQAQNSTSVPRFDVPFTSSAGSNRKTVSIGDELVGASRKM
jgi:hypothetical protein